MAFEFKLPDLGEGITEGEVVKWHVKPGDAVEEHQVVMEVETDKAIVEVPSPRKGVIKSLGKEEGDTVNVGETLLTIAEEGEEAPEEEKAEEKRAEKAEEAEAEEKKPEKEEKKPEKEEKKAGEAEKKEKERRESVSVVGEVPETEEILAAPKVRKIARDLGVDLSAVSGTGPGGVITEDDVKKAAEAGAPAGEKKAPPPEKEEEKAAPAEEKSLEERRKEAEREKSRLKEAVEDEDKFGPIIREPIKGVRKTIARNLIASQQAAAFVTGMDEADVTDLWDLRSKERKVAKERGIHLTFMPFFMKAVRHALEQHPRLNGCVPEGGDELVIKKYYNIGVAVDTPEGLMVAVLRDVDKKTILEIAEELQELSRKAIDRKITLEELKGSSFTITNYGSYAGTFATPIINPPDIAILGTGRIADKPWVVDGEIKVRKILPLSLTFDHRVVDGVESAKFLSRVIQYLEDPDQIFIESA